MKATSRLHSAYHSVARSRRLVSAAAVLRNQLDHVIRYHFGDTYTTCEAAEDLLIRTVGPHVHRFVDVGANVGRFTTKMLCHASSDCRGLLIEPSTSALAHLHRTFATESRLEVIAAAAGEREGVARFYEEPAAGETSTLVAGAAHGTGTWREIRLETVDGLLEARAWPGADFVKIDAEGYDLRVLEGMARALEARRVGAVLFEYNTSWRQAGALLENAAALLGRAGYELFLLRGDGIHRPNVQRFGEYFAYSNYVAVSPHFADGVRPIVRGDY